MSGLLKNQTALQAGDVVLLDGGEHIIESVGVRASARQLNPKPGQKPQLKSIPTELPRHLVVESRGEAGLRALRRAKAERHRAGEIKVEPGDVLCHGGELRTVVSVTETGCVLGNLAGQEFPDTRWLNEFLCQCPGHPPKRLNEQERADNLKDFLATRKPPVAQATATSGATTVTENKPMAKKAKAVKAEKKEQQKQTTEVSQKQFIEGLCDGKHTKSEAVALCVATYGTSEKAAKGAVNNCRHFQKKEGRPVGEWAK